MSKKKTHEEYDVELAMKNPNVEVVDRYINEQTKIMHHCLIHDEYWGSAPVNMLKGCGCLQCKSEKIRNKSTMSHDEYVDILRRTNPDVVVLEKYISAKTPILHHWYQSSFRKVF